MTGSVRVVKLGGSLLGDARFPRLARRWLDRQPSKSNVLVVGGGLWADGVRDAFHRFSLSESFCHWLCVDLLEQTSQLAAELLDIPSVDNWRQLEETTRISTVTTIFRCGAFLREIEPKLGQPILEHSWAVTTDSIAARIAQLLGADELVLWKSAPPPLSPDWRDWSRANYVDASFPLAAKDLSVRAVDLLGTDVLSQ